MSSARPGVPLLLLAAAVCLPLTAQQPNSPLPRQPAADAAQIELPPPPQGRLSGLITCADTHRPARGALVQIESKGDFSKTVRTGNDGRYIADHLPAGEYVIWTYFPGYVSRSEYVPGYTDPQHADAFNKARDKVIGDHRATLRDGGTAEIDEVLQRGVAFNGRVLYSDGSPATQVTLFVEPVAEEDADSSADDDAPTVDIFTSDREARTHHTNQSISTDDRGNFRAAGFPPGTYTVGAAVPPPNEEDWLPHHGTREDLGLMPGTGEVVLYAGKSKSTLHQAQARTYKLAAGEEERNIEITLPAEGFHTVSGHLLAPDGRPLNLGDLTLTDTTDDDLTFEAAPIFRDGSFTCYNVPNGSYKLEATNASIGKLDPRITSMPLREDFIEFAFDEMYEDGSMPVLVNDSDVTGLVFTLQKAPPEPETPAKAPAAPDGASTTPKLN